MSLTPSHIFEWILLLLLRQIWENIPIRRFRIDLHFLFNFLWKYYWYWTIWCYRLSLDFLDNVVIFHVFPHLVQLFSCFNKYCPSSSLCHELTWMAMSAGSLVSSVWAAMYVLLGPSPRLCSYVLILQSGCYISAETPQCCSDWFAFYFSDCCFLGLLTQLSNCFHNFSDLFLKTYCQVSLPLVTCVSTLAFCPFPSQWLLFPRSLESVL